MIKTILENLKHKNNFIKDSEKVIPFKEIYEELYSNKLEMFLDSIKEREVVVLNIKDHITYTILFLKLWEKGSIILPANSWEYDALTNILKTYTINHIITDNNNLSTKQQFEIFDNRLKLVTLSQKFNTTAKDDFLYMFTSGTTSVPKLVRLSYTNVEHNVKEIKISLKIEKNDYGLIMLPLEHGYALIGQLLVSLYAGVNIYFFYNRPINQLFNIIACEKITILWTVALYLRMISIFKKESPTVRLLSTAGAKFPFEVYNKVKKMFPYAIIINNYGGTEASPRISYIYDTDAKFLKESIGKPIGGTEVKITEDGKLAYRGKGIMIGYLNQKERKDDYFVTNDLVSIDEDGYIFLKGRADENINLGGKKVNLNAIRDYISKIKSIESFECKYNENGNFEKIDIKLRISENFDNKFFLEEISKTFNIGISFLNVIVDETLPIYNRIKKS